MANKLGANWGRTLLGGFIVLLGFAFLVENQTDFGIWRLWPVGLILFGAFKLFFPESQGGRIFGILMIAAGLFFLFDLWQLWPLLVIALGLSLIWGGIRRGKVLVAGASSESVIHEFVIFGGSERRMTAQEFQGGDVTTVFGGADLDLRDAKFTAQGAVLDVVALFGGVELRLPEGTEVRPAANVIFGSFEDKTRAAAEGAAIDGPRPVLTIRGYVLFGGVEVKN